ncbi:MAG: flavohemoglobin expression-modulating QEGLA motif protein [Ilumatobacter fluminis]|uniref:flavohemoglobin expression-modulating QEGLA motif protein n=1 Tax=Ilumatobacter fluminis TaxID=467091 RepID=UPI0032EC0E73
MHDDAASRYRSVSRQLHDIAKPMRVLSRLNWPGHIREDFLAGGASSLPSPTYEPFDATDTLAAVEAARSELEPGSVVDDWLVRECDAIEATARMLASVGTADFHEYSARLYGSPTRPLPYDPATPLDLANRIHTALDELATSKLLPQPIRDQTALDVVSTLEPAVRDHFGEQAPEILIVDELSANAVASTSRIKVRRDARFTRKDALQLLNHEAHIHVATGLNGRAQTEIPILAIGHPGTTRTQEGLAVYAEYLSGTLGLDRLRRLADRIVAVQLAADGADFIEVFRWFRERSADDEQAFESTRRIFRGAPIGGGAPFTKDCAYLSGFLSVATFVRAAFNAGRADTVALLFSGKLDLWSVAALAELRDAGLVNPARFLPPWASDPSWVLTHLTLSTFQAGIDLDVVTEHIAELLEQVPAVDIVAGARFRAEAT